MAVLNRDLQAAGIPKRDDRGRTVDVHALRTSFGTHLSKGGVPVRALAPTSGNSGTSGASADRTGAEGGASPEKGSTAVSPYHVQRNNPLSFADNGFRNRARQDLNLEPADSKSATLSN